MILVQPSKNLYTISAFSFVFSLSLQNANDIPKNIAKNIVGSTSPSPLANDENGFVGIVSRRVSTKLGFTNSFVVAKVRSKSNPKPGLNMFPTTKPNTDEIIEVPI